MLELAIEADAEWDSSSGWDGLARAAASAAIAESTYPSLLTSPRTIELSIRLTGDEEVRELNARWRGKDEPTNVLSFPLAEQAELEEPAMGPEVLLGDVVLARGTCLAEAAEKGIGVKDHVAHLLVHGTLHLLGHDHGDDRAAEDMERREAKALSRLGIADPYRDAG